MGLLDSYVSGGWQTPDGRGIPVHDAVTGDVVSLLSSAGIDMGAVLDHGRRVGGPALRELTFHQRGAALEALASFLHEHREELYALSLRTGATRADARHDVDDGIGVLSSYADTAQRELPDGTVCVVDGDAETSGTGGAFPGRTIATPLQGVAIQLNAFPFPVRGPLEKLAPAFIAGMPSVVKPASQTAYLTHRLVELIIESGLLPEGTVQLIMGSAGDLLDHVTGQDVVSFTGSTETGQRVRSHPTVVRHATRVNIEVDSGAFSVLGPDATPETAEFPLYVDQLVTDMTVKAGQHRTAVRRAFVPDEQMDDVVRAMRDRLSGITVGHPAHEDVAMGPLAGLEQRAEVRRSVKSLADIATVVFGDPDHVEVIDADPEQGGFLSPILLRSDDPERGELYEIEASGPVTTLIPYRSTEQLISLAARGRTSLTGSMVSADRDFLREVVLGTASWHGGLLVRKGDNATEPTGNGSAVSSPDHGSPGCVGAGPESDGVRGVLRYLRHSVVQADPETVRAITGH